MTKDWTNAEKDIRQWYCVDRKSLREVQRLAKEKWGFHASIRAYRSKLFEWGCRKVDGKEHDEGNPTTYRSKYLDSLREIISTEAISEGVPTPSPIFAAPNLHSTMPNLYDSPETSKPAQNYVQHASGHGPYIVSATREEQRETLLHEAVSMGKLDEAKSLLDGGVDVDCVDRAGRSTLHLAILKDSEEEMINLLLDYGARVDALTSYGTTPLHTSIRSISMLQILLKFNPDLSRIDVNGNTALHEASLGVPQTSAAFRRLVDHRANLNLLNHAAQSPFHLLLANPNDLQWVEDVRYALKRGASVSQRNHRAQLPIYIFIRSIGLCKVKNWHGWTDTFQLFMQRGASLDGEFGSGNDFFHTLFGRSWEILDYRTLMFFCLHLNPRGRGLGGNTALHLLAHYHTSFSLLEPFETLFRRGADPNAENKKGQTPYHMLCAETPFHESNLWRDRNELFLRAGADPLHNSSGTPPIYELLYKVNPSKSSKPVKKVIGAIVEHSYQDRLCSNMEGYDWWKKFLSCVSIVRNRDWVEADRRLQQNMSPLPKRIDGLLRTSARIVLAEFALKKYKLQWESKYGDEGFDMLLAPFLDTNSKSYGRTNFLKTLKGCRADKIAINPDFYQMSLDMIERD